MKKLAALLLLLIALLGVCSAQAAVDEVTVSITVVDSVTLKPIPKNFYVNHIPCKDAAHTPANCTCYRFEENGIQLSACHCGAGTSVGNLFVRGDGNAVCTFTIKTGHQYHLHLQYSTFGSGEYHLEEYPGATMYADPATGKVTFTPNNIELVQTGDYAFQWRLHTRLSPVTVRINATKLMDGKDPGDLKFAFKVWSLTFDQAMSVFELSQYFPDGELPEWKDEYDNMTPEEIMNDMYPLEMRKALIPLIRNKLEQYPGTIVYNDGKTVPFVNRTFTAYDFPPYTNTPQEMEFFYAIAEVDQAGNGICEDNAIYLIGGLLDAFYSFIPSSVNPDELQAVPKYSSNFTSPAPIRYSLNLMLCCSETGFLQAEWGDVRPEDLDLSDYFVFRNTTCPYADPGPTATPEPAPDVPATADGGFPIYWAALLLVGVMAMILRPRRA